MYLFHVQYIRFIHNHTNNLLMSSLSKAKGCAALWVIYGEVCFKPMFLHIQPPWVWELGPGSTSHIRIILKQPPKITEWLRLAGTSGDHQVQCLGSSRVGSSEPCTGGVWVSPSLETPEPFREPSCRDQLPLPFFSCF